MRSSTSTTSSISMSPVSRVQRRSPSRSSRSIPRPSPPPPPLDRRDQSGPHRASTLKERQEDWSCKQHTLHCMLRSPALVLEFIQADDRRERVRGRSAPACSPMLLDPAISHPSTLSLVAWLGRSSLARRKLADSYVERRLIRFSRRCAPISSSGRAVPSRPLPRHADNAERPAHLRRLCPGP
jgi:hypothetical protein